jgi:hypothetical protein
MLTNGHIYSTMLRIFNALEFILSDELSLKQSYQILEAMICAYNMALDTGMMSDRLKMRGEALKPKLDKVYKAIMGADDVN